MTSDKEIELQRLLDDVGLETIADAVELFQVKNDEKIRAIAEGKSKRILAQIEEEILLLTPAIDLWHIISSDIGRGTIDDRLSALRESSSKLKDLMVEEEFVNKEDEVDIQAVFDQLLKAETEMTHLKPGAIIYNNRKKTVELCNSIIKSLTELADSSRTLAQELTTHTSDSCGETSLSKIRLKRDANERKIARKKEIDSSLVSENDILNSLLGKWEIFDSITDCFPGLLEYFPEVSDPTPKIDLGLHDQVSLPAPCTDSDPSPPKFHSYDITLLDKLVQFVKDKGGRVSSNEMTDFYRDQPTLTTSENRKKCNWTLRKAVQATELLTCVPIESSTTNQEYEITLLSTSTDTPSNPDIIVAPLPPVLSVIPTPIPPATPPVDLPYDCVYVFHDAENCYIPKRFESRNPDGSLQIDSKGKVIFLDKAPQGMFLTANGGVLYNEVLRVALTCRLGEALTKPLDIGRAFRSVVNYNFVLHISESNPFHPTHQSVKGLQMQGVHLINVSPKSKDSACGDVDNKIKQLMKEALVNVKLFAAESRSRTLFVLISGDRDFAPEIKDIRSAGLDIAVIHNPDNPLSPDMVSLLAGKEWAPCAWLNILNLARKKDVPTSIVPMIKSEHLPKTVISTPVKAIPVVPSSDSKAAVTETIKIKFPTHKALFTKGFELENLKISLEAICADIFVELQQSEPKKIELLVHFENPKDATPKNKAEIQAVTRAYLDTIYEIIFPLYGVSHDTLRKHPQYSSLKSKCRVFSREFKVPDEKVEALVDPTSTAAKKAWFDLYDDESVGVINVALLGTNEEKLLEVKRYLLSLSEQKIKIKIPNERLYLLCQRAWPIIKPEAVVSSISKDEVTLTGPQDAIDFAIAELQAKLRTIQQLKVNVPKPNPKQSRAGLKMALKEDIKLIYDDLRSNLLLIHISDNVSAPAPVVAAASQSPKGKGSSTVTPAVAPGAIPFSVSVLTISPPTMSFGALTEGKALTDLATEGSSSEGAFIDGSAIKQRLEKLLKEYNERYVAVSDIRKSLSTAPPVILKLLRSNFPDLLGCRVTQSGFLCLQGKVVDIEEVVDFLTVEPKTEKATFAFIEREKVFVDWCKRNKRDVTTVIENLSKKHPGVKFVTHALKATVVVRLQGLLASLQPARNDAELKFDELNAKLVKRSLPMTPYDFQFLHSDRAALEDKALKACVVLQHTVVAETATTAVEDGCVLLATAKFGVTELRVMRGSMLDVCSQAILNPANPTLSHGAGAARAIRDAAGEEIDQEGQKLLLEKSGGKIPVGESVITKAYKLTERNQRLTHVIHAVGPVYRSGDAKERKMYRSTIHSALHLAMVNDIKEVAIPLFGSGVYGWPCSVAATELVLAISEWLAKSDSEMEQITLIDVVEDTVITILQSLRKFAERNPNDDDTSSSDVDDDLLVALPRIATPINSWSWEVAQNEQFKLADKSWKDGNGQSWVRYDYQQNLIIEGAFGPNGLPPPVGNGVIIRGDIGGVLSDSKFVPEGERSAVYAIFRDNCISDVSRKPYAFYQKNMKSSFRRAVRCDPFTPDMKIFGFNDVDDEEDVVVRPISGDGVKVKSFDNGDLCPVIIIEDFLLSKAAVVDGSVQMKTDTAANQKMINVFGTNDAITAFDQKLSKLLKANAKESEPIDFPPSEPWNTLRLKLLSQLASLAIEVEVTDVTEYQVVLKTTGDLFLFKAVAAVTKFAKKLVDEMPDKEFAVQWPSYWENSAVSSSSDDTTRLYDVAQGSSEWEQVIEQLLWPKQTFNKKVVKVDRIQNPKAYAAYYTKLLFLASKSNNRTGTLTEKANEKIMKHGTRNTEPSEIYKNDYGLDHKYSAAEGNYYGQAAYTAEDAEYSHSYRYNIPGSKPQLSQILLVRVAAGNIFEVKQRTAEHTKWKRAPPGFDTVRGDVRDGNHFAIMVYSAEYAYPDYLVTYEA